MAKLILTTEEEYTTFPVLVDGMTYDDVTVDAPHKVTCEISKSTMEKLKNGELGETQDLTEIEDKLTTVDERLDAIDDSIEDINEILENLPSNDSSSTELENLRTAQEGLSSLVNTIKQQVEANTADLLLVKNSLAALTQRVDNLDPFACGCGCGSTTGNTTGNTTSGSTTTDPTNSECGCGCGN